MTNREELLTLIPAYALGALDSEDRAAVEALLVHDTEAQQLLAEYAAINEILALSAPAHTAPSSMRDGLKAKLAARQTPSAEKQSSDHSPTNLRTFPVWSLMMSAAAVIAVIVGVLMALPATDAAAVYARLTASDVAQRFALTPDLADSVTGELVVSADGQQAVLRVADLPPLTDEQSYQLWLIGAEQVVSGGVFNWATDDAHYAILPLTEPLDSLQAIGMSLEPRGGSPYPDRPSGPRLFAVDVSSAG